MYREDAVQRIGKRKRARTEKSTRGEATGAEAANALFVGVVHADDGVRFMAAATSRRELVNRLADHVRRWGGYLLRPDHARHVRTLLLRGESEAAVELYFGLVGKRWDKEWLVTAVVPQNEPQAIVAVVGEVALTDALPDQRRSFVASSSVAADVQPDVKEPCGLFLGDRRTALG